MGQIFISYRRSDSSDATGRLCDRLRQRFGPDALFMDVDSILPGIDFQQRIRAAIFESHVLLVIIGNDWIEARFDDGRRRLDEPNDYVRIEIETAFEAGLVVVPVLVRDAVMPHAEQLPESLRRLTKHNAAEVRSGRNFDAQFTSLAVSLETHLVQRGVAAVGSSVASPRLVDAATDREQGVCLKCGRRNPSERKFCGGCREPLSELCFACEFENGASDRYCGKCGEDLAALRQTKVAEYEQRRIDVETAAQEFRLADAIRAAELLAAERHPRLRDIAHWAATRHAALQREQAAWQTKITELVDEAERAIARCDYSKALELLSGIPQSLRSTAQQQLWKTTESQAAASVKELEKLRSEEHELRETIERSLRSQSLDADMASYIDCYLALPLEIDAPRELIDAGLKVSDSSTKERYRAARTRELVRPWLDRIDEAATSCRRSFEYEQAVRLWRLIPPGLRDPSVVTSLAETERVVAALEVFRTALASHDSQSVLNSAAEILAVAPSHPEAKLRSQEYLEQIAKAAEQAAHEGRFAAALTALDSVPLSLSLAYPRIAELRTTYSRAQIETQEFDRVIRNRWKPDSLREALELIRNIDHYLTWCPKREDYSNHRRQTIAYLIDNGCRALVQGSFAQAGTILTAVAQLESSELTRDLSGLAKELASNGGNAEEPTSLFLAVFQRLAQANGSGPRGIGAVLKSMRRNLVAAARRHHKNGAFDTAIALLEQIPADWRDDDVALLERRSREAQLHRQTQERRRREHCEAVKLLADSGSSRGMLNAIRVSGVLESPSAEVHLLIDRLNGVLARASTTAIERLCFTDDSGLAFIDGENHLKFWDLDRQERSQTRDLLQIAVSSIANDSKARRIIAGLVDGSVFAYRTDGTGSTTCGGEPNTLDALCSVAVVNSHWHAVKRVNERKLVCFSQSEDASRARVLDDAITALQIMPVEGGVFAAYACETRYVRIWDPFVNSRQQWSSARCASSIKCLAVGSGMVYAGCEDGRLYQWRAYRPPMDWDFTGITALTMSGHVGPIAAIATTEDRPRLVSAGADKTVRLWNTDDGMLLRTFIGHEAPVRSLAVSSDGCFAASGDDCGHIRLWWIGE